MSWIDGTFRRVALINSYAIKFAKGEKGANGYWCNREEVRLSLRVRRPILCPLLAYDPFGRWAIFRRARTITVEEQWLRRSELYAIRREFKTFAGFEIDDDRASNLGDLDGRLVLLDFAGVPPEAAFSATS